MKRFLACFLLVLAACSPQQTLQPVTLVIASWYGFYPLYYAAELGLDKANGLRLKVLEPDTVSNLRRSYMRDQVDAVATSMVEFTNATTLTGLPIKPLVITDFSNGGDVIVAHRSIKNTEELLDMRVAVPSKGIGEFVLQLALDKANPMQHIRQYFIDEAECGDGFERDLIDACVTYPPVSTYLLESNEELHEIYNSSADPTRIFDLIWVKPDMSDEVANQLRTTWFQVIDHINNDPQRFYAFAASIANVNQAQVAEAMKGIRLVDQQQHQTLIATPDELQRGLVDVCGIAQNPQCEQHQNAFEKM